MKLWVRLAVANFELSFLKKENEKIKKELAELKEWSDMAVRNLELAGSDVSKYRNLVMRCIDKLKITCMGNEYDWHEVGPFVEKIEGEL